MVPLPYRLVVPRVALAPHRVVVGVGRVRVHPVGPAGVRHARVRHQRGGRPRRRDAPYARVGIVVPPPAIDVGGRRRGAVTPHALGPPGVVVRVRLGVPAAVTAAAVVRGGAPELWGGRSIEVVPLVAAPVARSVRQRRVVVVVASVARVIPEHVVQRRRRRRRRRREG